MSDEPMAVTKYGAPLDISQEAWAGVNEAIRAIPAAFERALNATPQERAEWAHQLARREAEAAQKRGKERSTAPLVPLTVEALMAKMQWDREFAEHLVQPYCGCHEDSEGGWSFCEHARDLGLAP